MKEKIKTIFLGKRIWSLIIIAVIILLSYIFFSNRLIPSNFQIFGPVSISNEGEDVPWSDVNLRVECVSNKVYFSENSNISCKVLAILKREIIVQPLSVFLDIYGPSNKTYFNCESSFTDLNAYQESSEICKDSKNNVNFELEEGDYKISASKFTIIATMGTVTIEKAIPVIFNGKLHIISEYEMRNRLIEDGMSIATFLAFLFIIPTAFLEIRNFLREK